jgi:hypothetical protein
MQIKIVEQPPIPKEVNNPETLAYYVASSLGLIPERGKGDVVIELLLLFRRISQLREGEVSVGSKNFPVKNGSMKVKDILEYLQVKGHNISQSQLYSTYLRRFIEAGLITKRKGSMYGLRAQTYELTLDDVFHDLRKVWGKIVEHARRVDQVIEEGK